jgi:hypothetical protein
MRFFLFFLILTVLTFVPALHAQDDKTMTWSDPYATPISDLKILLRFKDADGNPTEKELITDSRGISPRISSDNPTFIRLIHPAFTLEIPSRDHQIFIADGQAVIPISITPDKPNDISGTVLAPDSQPLAGARVAVAKFSQDGSGSGELHRNWLITGPDGSFAFSSRRMFDVNRKPPNPLVHLDVLSYGLTGPIPARAVLRPGITQKVTLKKLPPRNIVFVDHRGNTLDSPQAHALLTDAFLSFTPVGPRASEGPMTVALQSHTAVPLASGEYSLFDRDRNQFGPAIIDEAKPGPLVLTALTPVTVEVTVLDALTAKPLAGKTLFAVRSHIFTGSLLTSGFTREDWEKVMAMKTPNDAEFLPDNPRKVFKSFTSGFSLVKTDARGIATIVTQPRNGYESLHLIALGPDDYPLVTCVPPLLRQATYTRYPIAFVTVKPTPAGEIPVGPFSKSPATCRVELIRPPDHPPLDGSRPYFLLPTFNAVKLSELATIPVPAGLPLVLRIGVPNPSNTILDSLTFVSPTLMVQPGQTHPLGDASLTRTLVFQITFEDARQGPFESVRGAIKDANGTFKPLLRADFGLYAHVPSAGTYTVGMFAPWQGADESIPAYQATAELKRPEHQVPVCIDIDYFHLRRLRELSSLPSIVFTDARGKPMPEGTLLTGVPYAGNPAATQTLDAKGSITGKRFASVFINGMTLSHPDYGRVVLTDHHYTYIEWKKSQALPLISKSSPDLSLRVTGILTDRSGKPIPARPVLAGLDNIAFLNPSAPIRALTASDGSFAVHPILAGVDARQIATWKKNGFTGNLFIFPGPPNDIDWGLITPIPYAKPAPMFVTPVYADRRFTVTMPPAPGKDGNTPDSKPIPVTPHSAYFKPTPKSAPYTVTLFQGPGPWPLAAGEYTFHYGDLLPFTVTPDSPPIIALTRKVEPKRPVTGAIVRADTNQPIPDALVLGTHWFQPSGYAFGPYNDAFWADVLKLPLPIDPKTAFPREFVITLRVDNGSRTTPKGEFNLPPIRQSPDSSSASTSTSLYILAKGYVPMALAYENRLLTVKNENFQLPLIKLYPAAQVTLEPDLAPQDGAPGSSNVSTAIQWPLEMTEKNGQLFPLATQLDIPSGIPLKPATLSLPANIPLRLFLSATFNDDAPNPANDNPLWEPAQDQPLTFKPGQEITLKLKRVPQAVLTVQVLKPDGSPVQGLVVTRLLAENPNLTAGWPKTDHRGIATLCVPFNRSSTLVLNPYELQQSAPRFQYQTFNSAPTQPLVIKLTPKQWAQISPTLS